MGSALSCGERRVQSRRRNRSARTPEERHDSVLARVDIRGIMRGVERVPRRPYDEHADWYADYLVFVSILVAVLESMQTLFRGSGRRL
jgi:hypothetical protein